MTIVIDEVAMRYHDTANTCLDDCIYVEIFAQVPQRTPFEISIL